MAGGIASFASGFGGGSADSGTDLEKGIVEGDSSNEGGNTLVHREFFWDRLTTFIVSVLFGLATLNLFTQLLPRDSGIACDFSTLDSNNVSEATAEYLLGLCSKGLPPLTFLPVGIIVQGVLIAGPHFIWKSTFLSQFDFFFSSVSTLGQRRDPRSGLFPIENKVLIKQLETSFTFCDHSNIFVWYQRKMFVQFIVNLIVAIVSFAVPLTVYNTDTFDCGLPSGSIWPHGTNIPCVLVTFRLFALIWACDVTLILIMLPLLFWGILWCYLRHPTQLGHEDIAAFSFNSGIVPIYAFPKPYFPSGLRNWVRDFHGRFFHPCIQNDLDFMMMSLYKANDGVGQVFKEGLVEIETERLNDTECQLLDSFLRVQDDPTLTAGTDDEEMDERDKAVLSLEWNLPEKDVQINFKKIETSTGIRVPSSVRGVIMGLSLRAPNNYRALHIGFGSPYGNYALALARIFFKVGYINFDPKYRPTWQQETDPPIDGKDGDVSDSKVKSQFSSPSVPRDLIDMNEISASYVTFRVQDNILAQSTEHIKIFNRKLHALFKDEYDDDDSNPISFVTVGPICRKEHLTTAKLFFESTDSLADNVVVVTIRPISIEGRNTKKYLHKFTPPKSMGFKLLSHSVEVVNGTVEWNNPTQPQQGRAVDLGSVPLHCGLSSTQMEILAYYRGTNSTVTANP